MQQTTDFRIIDVRTVSMPKLPFPDPTLLHEQYGWCIALLQDSVTLVCSSLVFYLILFSGEMRDILGKF